MRRMVIYLALLLMASVQAAAQQVVLNKQRHFKKAVPAGNYSGVTWLAHRLHHRQDRGREGRQFYDLKPAEP